MKNKILPIILMVLAVLFIILGLCFFIINGNKKEKETKEPEQNEEKQYKNYDQYVDRYGLLIPMSDDNWKPLQEEFIIKGIILIGNKHSYYELEKGAENAIEMAVKNGYEEEGINSFFYLGENIKFYMDTKYSGKPEDVKIFVVPLMKKKELREISYADLKQKAEQNGFMIDYQKPDEANYKYVGENSVSEDKQAGQFDIVVTYKKKVAYYMDMIVSIEPKGR